MNILDMLQQYLQARQQSPGAAQQLPAQQGMSMNRGGLNSFLPPQDEVLTQGSPQAAFSGLIYPGSKPPPFQYPVSPFTNPFVSERYGWRSGPRNPALPDRPMPTPRVPQSF